VRLESGVLHLSLPSAHGRGKAQGSVRRGVRSRWYLHGVFGSRAVGGKAASQGALPEPGRAKPQGQRTADAMPERATLNRSGAEPLKGEARVPSDRILVISLTTLLQQSRYSAAPLYLYPF
jgi:hypothetical protein